MTVTRSAEPSGADRIPDAEHPVLVRLALEGTLGAQVRRGVAWSALSRVVLVAVQLGGSAVLARLLVPEHFGLVALCVVVNRLATLVTELGLSTAVVQSRRVTERLLSSAFWLNAAVGLTVTLLILGAAPLVAELYDEPRLTGLLQVNAIVFTLNLAAVPAALLQRALQFKRLAGLEVAATVTGLAVSIALAVAGAGPYALVLGPMTQVLVLNALVLVTVRWVPRALPHRAELGELWRFGRGLTGANLLYFTSRNADTVMLAQVVSFGQVGLYSRAYNIMMLPLAQVTTVLSRVLLPAYSQMQDDLPRLRRAWLTTVRSSLGLGLPAGLGVAASAPSVIGTLYGDQWLGATTTLVLLAASLPQQLLARNIGPMYQATGRTGLQFRVALATTALSLAAIAAGLPWGIEGVAVGLFVSSAVSLLIGLVPLVRLIALPPLELWRAVRGLLLAGVLMGLAAYGVGLLVVGLLAPAVLAVQAGTGAVVYLGVLWLVDREAVRPLLRRLRR